MTPQLTAYLIYVVVVPFFIFSLISAFNSFLIGPPTTQVIISLASVFTGMIALLDTYIYLQPMVITGDLMFLGRAVCKRREKDVASPLSDIHIKARKVLAFLLAIVAALLAFFLFSLDYVYIDTRMMTVPCENCRECSEDPGCTAWIQTTLEENRILSVCKISPPKGQQRFSGDEYFSCVKSFWSSTLLFLFCLFYGRVVIGEVVRGREEREGELTR
mgnify:FL=1